MTEREEIERLKMAQQSALRALDESEKRGRVLAEAKLRLEREVEAYRRTADLSLRICHAVEELTRRGKFLPLALQRAVAEMRELRSRLPSPAGGTGPMGRA